MRERRHNLPIDIDSTGVARARHEYDPMVKIVLPPEPVEGALTAKMVGDALDEAFNDTRTKVYTLREMLGRMERLIDTEVKKEWLPVPAKERLLTATVPVQVIGGAKGSANTTKNITVTYPESAALSLSQSRIERLNRFEEPQPNGAMLIRWEVGYWCEPESPLARPDQKLLLCQTGKESWVTFRVSSYSMKTRRGDPESFIEAWGYS